MVGVPRSKGCRICVQRRVKCDQSRPFCKNCAKGNRPCPGYALDHKFIEEGPKLRERYEQHRSASPEADDDDSQRDFFEAIAASFSSNESALRPLLPSNQWDMVGLDYPESAPTEFWSFLEKKGDFVPSLSDKSEPYVGDSGGLATLSAGSLNLDASFQDVVTFHAPLFSPYLEQSQLLYTFQSALAPNTTQSLPAVMRSHGRWLSHLPGLSGSHPLLDTSIRAVTLAHIGRQADSQTFLNESRPYYGKALRLLNSALLDDEAGLSAETLSATILLSFYEMFASDSNQAWVRHAGGAGTLMRIRGAARHRTGFDREIFLAYRHALIIEAFEGDKPCFLNEPEWRQVSEEIHEDIRTSGMVGSRYEIFDIAEDFFAEMVQVPATIHDARRLPTLAKEIAVAGGDGSLDGVKSLITRRASLHRSNLKSIYARFTASLKKYGHAPKSRLSGDPIIPLRYDHINIFSASAHTGYWTVLMLINILLKELNHGPGSDVNKQSLYTMENREAALDCCRTAEYMETSSFLGPFFVIFALRVSYVALEPKQEREWVLTRLARIGSKNLAMANEPPDRHGDLLDVEAPRIRLAVEQLTLQDQGYVQASRMAVDDPLDAAQDVYDTRLGSGHYHSTSSV